MKKAKKITKKPAKKIAKKAVKKATLRRGSRQGKPAAKKAAKKGLLGAVTHYYGGIEVGIIKLAKPLKLGARVHFKGATTDFAQTIDSMQYDRKDIPVGKKGQEVGVKVADKVREGDEVYEAAE